MKIEDPGHMGQRTQAKCDVLGTWTTEPAKRTWCRIAQCVVLVTRGGLVASHGVVSALLPVSNSHNSREWASSESSADSSPWKSTTGFLNFKR